MLIQFTNQTKLPPVRLITRETKPCLSILLQLLNGTLLTITQHTVQYTYNTFPYIIQYEHKISLTVQYL